MSAVKESIPDTFSTLDKFQQLQPSIAADPELYQKIAEAAYYIAEKRGFEPGCEQEDWLQAESDVLTLY